MLAIAFAKQGANVEGLEPSTRMIAMAKEKDTEERVTWINKRAEQFEFPEKKYDVVFSHDSFHLIDNPSELIEKIVIGLNPGGFFAVGSAMFNFDLHPEASEAYKQIFIDNIPTETEENFNRWACTNFSSLMSGAGLQKIKTAKVQVKEEYTTEQIINYLLNVSKTAGLKEDVRNKIDEELRKKFKTIFPDGKCIGYDEYSIIYGQKPPENHNLKSA